MKATIATVSVRLHLQKIIFNTLIKVMWLSNKYIHKFFRGPLRTASRPEFWARLISWGHWPGPTILQSTKLRIQTLWDVTLYHSVSDSRFEKDIISFILKDQAIIFVNKQLDPQFFFVYVYFCSLHVSDSYVSIIRRMNCINTTYGVCHSVSMTVWYA